MIVCAHTFKTLDDVRSYYVLLLTFEEEKGAWPLGGVLDFVYQQSLFVVDRNTRNVVEVGQLDINQITG